MFVFRSVDWLLVLIIFFNLRTNFVSFHYDVDMYFCASVDSLNVLRQEKRKKKESPFCALDHVRHATITNVTCDTVPN